MPRLPALLIYTAVVAALLIVSLGRRERANAPTPPPPAPFADQAPISPASPFAEAALVRIASPPKSNRGAAFSVNDSGVWLTARRAVDGCAKPMLVVSDGWATPARLRAEDGEVAVLTTASGAPALGFAEARRPRPGEAAFLAGFSKGGSGEVAALYLGAETSGGRLAWAEIGRTDGLAGPLLGMAGAPFLNGDGEIVGMALADAPRRGLVSAAPPEALTRALAVSRLAAGDALPAEPITLDNYGRAADGLRRVLSVVELVC